MKKLKWLSVISMFMFCIWIGSMTAKAESRFDVTGQCEISPKATIHITVDAQSYDGFDIYRADDNGNYQYVGSVGLTQKVLQDTYYDSENDYDSDNSYFDYDYSYDNYESEWVLENNQYVEYRKYTFNDPAELVVYQNYQYRVIGYKFVNDVKTTVGIPKDTTVLILSPGPALLSGTKKGKSGVKLQWNKANDADGYLIYCVADFDEKDNYVYVDLYDYSQYKLLKTITDSNTVSAEFNNLKNGVTYTYRICAYKNINGKKVESTLSPVSSVVMDSYTCNSETYSQRIKRAFGSEKKKKNNFKTAKKASRQMKTIKIKVWDFKRGKSGKKVTKTKYLTVNKRLAPSIQQMFTEIYNSSEKQVIKDIGCYSYRQGEHMYGMAIDINPNENYMVDKVNGKKKILCGSYWKPNKDPYSIPADWEMVRIMRRYGFYRGEWGDRNDYMHFSYFGT